MRNLTKILGVSALLLLASCADKKAPSIAPGEEGLKFVASSNVLDSDKNPTILGRNDSIQFTFEDSLVELSVKVRNSNGLVSVEVIQDGSDVIIVPVAGTWNSSRYTVIVSGALADGTPVNFTIDLDRELGVNYVKSNVYNVEKGTGFQDVAPDLAAIEVTFDQAIEKVSDATLTINNVEVAVSITITDTLVQIDPLVETLGYNNAGQISFQAVTADNQVVSVDFSFKTAGSDLVPVATNVEIYNSSVGEVTTGFGIDQTMWVVFSDSLDLDLKKIEWETAPGAGITIPLVAGGTAANINASVAIAGDTLKVTPNATLKGVNNSSVVGFKATVVSKKGLTYEVTALAYVTANDVYVVSTNVQEDNGLYRAFKVIGDSLVVKFSKPINYSASARTQFRVDGWAKYYTTRWSKDSMTAFIKNIDTLMTSDVYGLDAYEPTSTTTKAYAEVRFMLTTNDGEEVTVAPVQKIQVHTEQGLAIVNSNILHKHLNSQNVVTADEAVKDTIAANGNITIEFNRAVDTAAIKLAPANTHFVLWEGGKPNIQLPITLSFSKDAKTVTLNPETDLKDKNTEYFIRVLKVPGLGIANAPKRYNHSGKASGLATINDGGDIDGNLSSKPLKVYFKPVVISALKATVQLDTNDRLDSSFSAGYTYGDVGAGAIKVLIKHPAWKKNHCDSVDAYQVRFQKTTKAGVASGWFYANELVETDCYDTTFVTSASNPVQQAASLDVSAEDFYSALQTADGDGADAQYSNDPSLFNDSSKIEFQVRAIKDADYDGVDFEDGETGVWSSSVTIADNTAPCDKRLLTEANMNDKTEGGVSIDATGNPSPNRTSLGLAQYTITLTFPEDMNPSSKPKLWPFYEVVPATKLALNSSESGWTNARTYKLVYTMAANINYTGAYYAIDVSGMKDASGVSIILGGDRGDAADLTSLATAAADETKGPENVQGLAGF